MLRNGAIKAALGVLASAGLVFGAVSLAAANSTATDPFAVNYFTNAQTGGPVDTLRIVDPDTYGSPVDACANIYVFDAAEEMEECCACPITPAGRLDFNVNTLLTSAPVTGVPLSTGTIKIVKTNTNPLYGVLVNPLIKQCDPTNGTNGFPGNVAFHALTTPGSSLFSWITHDLNRFATGGTAVAEQVFESTGEPASDYTTVLAPECYVTQNSGGSYGTGVCAAAGCPVEVP
ncbi:MAG: hypothetical protein ABR989_13120 [Candidatus Binatus soli]|jgi:hypothetical protein